MKICEIESVRASHSQRVIQASVLWAHGFGTLAGFSRFPDYIREIPEVPGFASKHVEHFQRLVLVDTRVPLGKLCEQLHVEVKEPRLEYHELSPKLESPVYWALCQDGSRDFSTLPATCQSNFSEFETGCNIREGLAMLAQDPTVLSQPGAVMDLVCSTHRLMRSHFAGLRRYDNKFQLLYPPPNVFEFRRGSASRLKSTE